jgi:hypothetical protein
MAVRPARVRMVGRNEIDLDARGDPRARPDEYATALERAHRSLAALAELKPRSPGRCCCRPPAAPTRKSIQDSPAVESVAESPQRTALAEC